MSGIGVAITLAAISAAFLIGGTCLGTNLASVQIANTEAASIRTYELALHEASGEFTPDLSSIGLAVTTKRTVFADARNYTVVSRDASGNIAFSTPTMTCTLGVETQVAKPGALAFLGAQSANVVAAINNYSAQNAVAAQADSGSLIHIAKDAIVGAISWAASKVVVPDSAKVSAPVNPNCNIG